MIKKVIEMTHAVTTITRDTALRHQVSTRLFARRVVFASLVTASSFGYTYVAVVHCRCAVNINI